MDFSENRAIYLQIVEWVYEKILSAEWKQNDRIPAVRELAIALEVNPNTVMRTYQHLESMNIITLKRGTGYYLTDNAYGTVYEAMKSDFLNNQIPVIFKNLSLLKVTKEELLGMYSQYLESKN